MERTKRKKMKLLFYDFEIPYLLNDSNYPVGGACVRQYAFSIGLSFLGQDVGVLTWKGANKFVKSQQPFKLVESYSIERGIRVIRWIYYRFPQLLRAILNFKPDFIFQKCAGANVGIMAIVGVLLNKPFIYISANDTDADDRYKRNLNFINMIFYKFGLKLSQGIICQNEYQYKQFKKKFPQKRITLIKNPFVMKEKIGINPKAKRKYIAWVGVFQHQKNLSALYRIANQNLDLEFHVAGKNSSSIDGNTKNALDKLRALPNVKFVGYLSRTDILGFLSKAYALLNTSHFEGFSNTFLESFAVGTPIISLNVNPDNIITKYDLGDMISLESNSHVFKKLLDSYDYLKEGIKIQKYLTSNHDYINIANQFLDFLED